MGLIGGVHLKPLENVQCMLSALMSWHADDAAASSGEGLHGLVILPDSHRNKTQLKTEIGRIVRCALL